MFKKKNKLIFLEDWRFIILFFDNVYVKYIQYFWKRNDNSGHWVFFFYLELSFAHYVKINLGYKSNLSINAAKDISIHMMNHQHIWKKAETSSVYTYRLWKEVTKIYSLEITSSKVEVVCWSCEGHLTEWQLSNNSGKISPLYNNLTK